MAEVAVLGFDKGINSIERYIDLSCKDEKFARTIFHHITEGLKYLHLIGVRHLDLKPRNIILGHNKKFRITNLDSSYSLDGERVNIESTDGFRAPELFGVSDYSNLFSADMFSLGILLFYITFGFKPFSDNDLSPKYYSCYNSEKFWKQIKEMNLNIDISDSFIGLFNELTYADPTKRASFHKVEQNDWYKSDIYSEEELEKFLNGLCGLP